MSLRSLKLGLKLLSVIVLAGCGEDRGSGATAKTTPRPPASVGGRVLAVSLTEYRLTPPNPHVIRAGTITVDVVNDGDVTHALAVEGPVGDVRTAALKPTDRTTIALALPAGSYKWYCPLDDHERLGMTGAVGVAE